MSVDHAAALRAKLDELEAQVRRRFDAPSPRAWMDPVQPTHPSPSANTHQDGVDGFIGWITRFFGGGR
jgi:hypothetical protein